VTIEDTNALRGAAFHEAGHAIVARHFGQTIIAIEIHKDGSGKTDADGSIDHLSRIDKITLHYAGLASTNFFKCPTHKGMLAADHAEIIKLAEGPSEENSLEVRNAGYLRAVEIVKANATEIEQLATRLIEQRRIDGSAPELALFNTRSPIGSHVSANGTTMRADKQRFNIHKGRIVRPTVGAHPDVMPISGSVSTMDPYVAPSM
jgi:Peptidase M50B-like